MVKFGQAFGWKLVIKCPVTDCYCEPCVSSAVSSVLVSTAAPIINRGHIEDVYDLCWSSDSKYLMSGSVDNSVIVWNTTNGT